VPRFFTELVEQLLISFGFDLGHGGQPDGQMAKGGEISGKPLTMPCIIAEA
jgi:hypothetical protein